MINISPKLNDFKVNIGGPEKPSVSADLHVGQKISMGVKMRFPGAWLDKQRASLKQGSPQQKMFDVALDVLSGKVAPKAVRETATGREIDLDRPVLDATTLSIGFEKSLSDVLGFLGMKDGTGKELLNLGAKMADALSLPSQQVKHDNKATRNEFMRSCSSLATSVILREFRRNASFDSGLPASTNYSAGVPPQTSGTTAPPPLPPRPRTGADGKPAPNTQGTRTDTPPPLPPRPRAGANGKPSSNTQGPRSETPPPVPPRPPREPASPGQRQGAKGSQSDAPPLPARNKAPDPAQAGRQGRPFTAPPRSNSAPPPRPPKEGNSTEQPNWQAPPFGERMRANIFPGANPGSFEPDANETRAAAGNAAPEPGVKRRMSREEYENKINGGRRFDNSKLSAPPRPEKASGRPEAEQPNASAADAPAKVAEDVAAKPAVKALYKHLGLSSEKATPAEIRKAYRDGSLKFHPDRNQGDETATARFQNLGNAYAILSDENKRKRYDAGAINEKGHPTGVPFPS